MEPPTEIKELTREQWLEERRKFLTASDCAAVLGFDPYRTPAHVYADKRKLVEPEPESRFAKAGKKLEPMILDWYQEETGFDVRPNGLTIEVHPKYPWLGCTRDATAITMYADRRNVEAKATGYIPGQKWGEAGTDEVPERNLVQAQIQMACSGLVITDMPVLIAGNDFRIYTIEQSERFFEAALPRLEEFMEMVRDGIPPPLDIFHSSSQELAKRLYRNSVPGKEIELGPEILEFAKALQTARDSSKAADKQEKVAKTALMKALGDAQVGRVKGSKVLIRRNDVTKMFKPSPGGPRKEIHIKVEGEFA